MKHHSDYKPKATSHTCSYQGFEPRPEHGHEAAIGDDPHTHTHEPALWSHPQVHTPNSKAKCLWWAPQQALAFIVSLWIRSSGRPPAAGWSTCSYRCGCEWSSWRASHHSGAFRWEQRHRRQLSLMAGFLTELTGKARNQSAWETWAVIGYRSTVTSDSNPELSEYILSDDRK